MRRAAAVALALAVAGGSGAAFAASQLGGTSLRAQAAAEDQTLLQSAPTTTGETAASTAPSSILAQPPSEPAEVNLVIRSLYWTTDRSESAVYAALTGSTPTGFDATGHGTTSGPTMSDEEVYATYDPLTLPSTIANAELQVAVAPLSATTSAVGVYAEAVAIPPRPSAEVLPDDVSKVQTSWVVGFDAEQPLRRTVSAAQTKPLVSSFNALEELPPGDSSCAADFGQSQGATFTADGHSWTASTGACPGVEVTRDGKRLPTLQSSDAFYSALQAALGIGRRTRPAATRVPAGARHLRLARVQDPAGTITRSLTVSTGRGRALVEEINEMDQVRRGYYHCQQDAGAHVVVTFVVHGEHWRLDEAPCHTVLLTRSGHRIATLVTQDDWEQQIHQEFRR